MLSLRSLVVLVLLVPASAEGDPVGVWPLRPEPAVVRAFDPPDDKWGPGHRGVDLAGSVGQPVRSALPGAIAYVGHIAGKPVVTVSHGDTRTTYEPVTSDLHAGDLVDAGERIGSLDLGFSHCFPQACLHWGWLRGETYLDPLGLVSDNRVRLLPLWGELPKDRNASTGWRPPDLPALPVPRPLLPFASWSPRADDFLL